LVLAISKGKDKEGGEKKEEKMKDLEEEDGATQEIPKTENARTNSVKCKVQKT